MKNYRRLIGFAFLALILSCVQVLAQGTIAENTNQQSEKDEIEVTKFADSFLHSFMENKDLSKIPVVFFDDGLKNRFIKYPDCTAVDELIPTEERYKVAVASQNLTNLLTIIVSSKFDKEKDDSEDFSYRKYLPLDVLQKFEKSKWLKFMLDEAENYSEPKTPPETKELIEEMMTLSNEMALYLQNHPVKASEKYLKLREDSFKYYPAKICEGESCMGLPEKTPIFSVHELMMCLRIAKINDQWKIVQIYSVACED